MIIKRKLRLLNTEYFVNIECIYKSNKLCLKNYKDDYFDSGDLSILINKIEDNYNYEDLSSRYNFDIKFLVDIIYIYECIPFISGIGDESINSSSYMDISELEECIKSNNICLKDNSKFKLSDARTWSFN